MAVLERRLSPFDAAAIIVANVIGGGILFRSPAVAAAVPDPVWFLLAWAGGGVLAFMGAMAYAELAALRPKAGGEYVYLREAYGPLAGSKLPPYRIGISHGPTMTPDAASGMAMSVMNRSV